MPDPLHHEWMGTPLIEAAITAATTANVAAVTEEFAQEELRSPGFADQEVAQRPGTELASNRRGNDAHDDDTEQRASIAERIGETMTAGHLGEANARLAPERPTSGSLGARDRADRENRDNRPKYGHQDDPAECRQHSLSPEFHPLTGHDSSHRCSSVSSKKRSSSDCFVVPSSTSVMPSVIAERLKSPAQDDGAATCRRPSPFDVAA
jgi:hypothetical protein